jgi:hypothetical protein
MRTTKFSFFLSFLLSFLLIEKLKAQEPMCGTVTTTEDKNEIIRILRSYESNNRTSYCSDLQWSGGDVTYNLIL